MFGKKNAIQANPNEMVFTKTKGFERVNYAVVTSKVNMGDTGLSVERTTKVLFFKGKSQTSTVDYGSIARVDVKTHFAKGDFISAIVFGVICTIFAIAGEGESGEVWFDILVALAGVAALIFCSYGKNIIITRNDSSKVVIMSEGFWEKNARKDFCGKLAEKGIETHEGKK